MCEPTIYPLTNRAGSHTRESIRSPRPWRPTTPGCRKVRIRHEQQPGNHLRPSVLFLPVHEQDESDAAWDERYEQPRRIEKHRCRTVSSPQIVHRDRYVAHSAFSRDTDPRTDISARSSALEVIAVVRALLPMQ